MLLCRAPRRDPPTLAPDRMGTDAVLVNRANSYLSRKRCTLAVSPIITAAESPPSWARQQVGSDPTDEVARFGLEGIDLTVELVAPAQGVAGEVGYHTGRPGPALCTAVGRGNPHEGIGVGVEFPQVP